MRTKGLCVSQRLPGPRSRACNGQGGARFGELIFRAALTDGPCPLPLPGLVHQSLQSRLVGLRLPPPGEGALDIREDLRPHLLDGDPMSRRELVNPPLVHRSPPRGDERVQFALLLS